MSYDSSTTAMLLVDPYNDFLSEGGKLWPRVKAVAEEVELLDHLREVVSTARARGLKIFFVPHHRWESGDYVSFDNPSPYQLATARGQVFAKDTWGGTFHDDFQPRPGDVVIHEHCGSSGFANTDLDLQLKQHGVRRIILIGMIANTCIESTGRFGMELGYHVTLVKDATAAFSHEAMHAAHAINGPIFLGANDFDADTAERYGWINRAMPDAELDAFVANFVGRVLSFDRQALHTAKSIINHVGLPDPAALQSTQDIFFQSFTWEGAKERAPKLRERGIGQAGDFELDLGRHIGSL